LTGGRRGLDELAEAMRCSEAAHAWAFGAVAAATAGAAATGWLDSAAWLTLFNVLFNGYPVMLQRYNRLRLVPLLRAGRPPGTLF
jgi:Glycosyl-4,4'-diaponeurosporenoate acyltransferase